jgi:translation elongation factor EF-4
MPKPARCISPSGANFQKKEGKKTMRQFGKVDIPQEAFIAALKVDN